MTASLTGSCTKYSTSVRMGSPVETVVVLFPAELKMEIETISAAGDSATVVRPAGADAGISEIRRSYSEITWRGGPVQMTSPCDKRKTRSHKLSTAARLCETKTMVVPAFFN